MTGRRRYDTSFTVAGGKAYRRDDPRAEVHNSIRAFRAGFKTERGHPIDGRLHEKSLQMLDANSR
jgi:hypothetical protein